MVLALALRPYFKRTKSRVAITNASGARARIDPVVFLTMRISFARKKPNRRNADRSLRATESLTLLPLPYRIGVQVRIDTMRVNMTSAWVVLWR